MTGSANFKAYRAEGAVGPAKEERPAGGDAVIGSDPKAQAHPRQLPVSWTDGQEGQGRSPEQVVAALAQLDANDAKKVADNLRTPKPLFPTFGTVALATGRSNGNVALQSDSEASRFAGSWSMGLQVRAPQEKRLGAANLLANYRTQTIPAGSLTSLGAGAKPLILADAAYNTKLPYEPADKTGGYVLQSSGNFPTYDAGYALAKARAPRAASELAGIGLMQA